ncbi:MAG: hypothetical protein ACRDD7_18025 [Peptostreptococcaceae bacterium]
MKSNNHPCVGCTLRGKCNQEGCIEYLEYSLFKNECKELRQQEKASGNNQVRYDKSRRKRNTNTYLRIIGKTLDEALKLNIKLDEYSQLV